MASTSTVLLFVLHISIFLSSSLAADPYAYYDFEVSYITASPLGVPQQVIFIFPRSCISLWIFLAFWERSSFIFESWVLLKLLRQSGDLYSQIYKRNVTVLQK